MANQFKKHYTREEARALLPQLRLWLEELARCRDEFREYDQQLVQMLKTDDALGGEPVNRWIKALAGIRSILRQFEKREIQIKELDRGLIDFPAFIGGQEAFLCWEKDEDDIEYWHDLTSGYAGRERLEE
jgi:hypothetical protein